jgi:signal peptidase I
MRREQNMPASTSRAAKQPRHGRLRIRLTNLLPILTGLGTPFMLWKGLTVLTASSVPVLCVISESMAPAFHRGDLLLLSNRSNHIHAGDIPVVWFHGRDLPMVHRAVKVFNTYENNSDLPSRCVVPLLFEYVGTVSKATQATCTHQRG